LKNEEVGVMEKVLDYIRESRAELKKVTWPTKQQMWYSTLVVIVVTFMVSAYLGLVDCFSLEYSPKSSDSLEQTWPSSLDCNLEVKGAAALF
jgi:preprotein translocase, SecE subunit, bacterial